MFISNNSREAVASVLVHFTGGGDDGHDWGIKFGGCSKSYGQKSSENDLK